MARPRSSPRDAELPPSVVLMVRQALRGRSLLALLVTGALTIGGALLAYQMVQPTFRSQAILEFSPVQTAILYQTGEERVPMFDAFVNAQLLHLTSESIARAAMASEGWQALGTAVPTDFTSSQFRLAIDVDRDRRQQVAMITFEHADPQVAQAGAAATVHAFQAYFQSKDTAKASRRRAVLLAELEGYEGQLAEARKQRIAVAGGMDADGIQLRYELKLQTLIALEFDLGQAKLQSERLASQEPSADTDAVEPSPSAAVMLTTQQAASLDEGFASYLRQLEQIESELLLLASRFGRAHPKVKQYEMDANAIRARMADMLKVLTAQVDPASIDAMGSGAVYLKESELEGLRRQVEVMAAQIRQLAEQRARLAEITEQINRARASSDDTRVALETIKVESNRPGRLDILLDADAPTTGHMGRRRMQAAAIGGLAGAGLGLATLLGLHVMDRRLRGYLDVSDHLPQETVLGIIPTLADDLADPDSSLTAAMAIHEVRTRLQHNFHQAHVVAVTSPTTGDGKTTVSLALAMSFARSGCRTLLVDLDIVGRGVSHRLSKIDGQPGGPGVLDAMAGGDLELLCRPTQIEGMSILPVGNADTAEIGQISRRGLGKLFQHTREAFDVVLIDTGPVLGSLECAMLAPLVDGVLLIVARGDDRKVARAAIEKIVGLGGKIAGVIFNRADMHDCHKHASTVSSRMSRHPAGLTATPHRPAAESARPYGPVSAATASYLPSAPMNGHFDEG